MWAAIIPAAMSLLGSVMSSNAAKSAIKSQERGAAAADATQRYMYDTTRADQAPFRDTGVAANARLAYLMGLPGAGTGSTGVAGGAGMAGMTGGAGVAGWAGGAGITGMTGMTGMTGGMTREQIRAQLQGQFTTTTEGTPGTLAGNLNDYAMTPTPATVGTAGGQRIDEAGLNAAVEAEWARQQATQQGQAQDPDSGSLMRNFTMADRDADPVYQSGLEFGAEEGRKGIERQQSASGSMLSGATLKALTRFGSDYGSTKAQGAFDRFGSNQDRTYNKLAGLSGTGQVATGAIGQAGQNYANQVSNTALGLGNARGASAIAQSNAWTGGINNAIGGYQQNELLKMLQGRNTPLPTPSYYSTAFSTDDPGYM